MNLLAVTTVLFACAGYSVVSGYIYTTYYMDQRCRGFVDISYKDAVTIKLTASYAYRSHLDCAFTVGLPEKPGGHIMAKFSSMDIEYTAFCSNDHLDLYDGSSVTTGRRLTGIDGLCGYSTPSTVYKALSGYLTLRFRSDLSLQYRGFTLILTPYDSFCSSNFTSFMCNNGRCIGNSLTCDGWNNCGDNTDEVDGCGLSTGGVAGVVVASFIVFVVLLTLAIFFRRRRVRYVTLTNTVTSTTTSYGPPPAGAYPGYQQQQHLPPGAYPQ